jgi:hypothetical protein
MGRNKCHVYSPCAVVATLVPAASWQHTTVHEETVAAAIVAHPVTETMGFDVEITERSSRIAERLGCHDHGVVITTLLGGDPPVGAEFFAALGGEMAVLGTADHPAGVAGLTPIPRDSGCIGGWLHRLGPYTRQLLRVSSLCVQLSRRLCPALKTYVRSRDCRRVGGWRCGV